ncbi:PREDICTED: DNA-directed RNA polymerase III subunit RPC9 isoform X2 [Tinamus guttatus]|uniref:DNA-directed RNA polymerase III subunit RPC9 isoform X2 n=1 Tax=Tinamus guttatus TaxID=94827 RepID=UPI00052EB2DB|nr:PREDICTED: DNA-directed RNA polymerase III subunit RPC9 isoform X2 [Tinamus guttatus]
MCELTCCVSPQSAEWSLKFISAYFRRKDANAALLSNFEVYQLLTDLKQQRKESGKNKQSSGQQNLNTIMYETLKYISKTPCRYQSPETVRDFLTTMKGHKLTKAEKLQLLNHRPVTAVEIQLDARNASKLQQNMTVTGSNGIFYGLISYLLDDG